MADDLIKGLDKEQCKIADYLISCGIAEAIVRLKEVLAYCMYAGATSTYLKACKTENKDQIANNNYMEVIGIDKLYNFHQNPLYYLLNSPDFIRDIVLKVYVLEGKKLSEMRLKQPEFFKSVELYAKHDIPRSLEIYLEECSGLLRFINRYRCHLRPEYYDYILSKIKIEFPKDIDSYAYY